MMAFSATSCLDKYPENATDDQKREYMQRVLKVLAEAKDRYGAPVIVRTINEIQDDNDKMKEYMLLSLRKIEGVSISKFKTKFINNPLYLYRDQIEKLVNNELIDKINKNELELLSIINKIEDIQIKSFDFEVVWK